MAQVGTYLNFVRETEEAFLFYKSVFGGEFSRGGIARFSDIPPAEGMPPMSEADRNLVMHVELPILGGHLLMGTDAPESMGFQVVKGNNFHINLEPDSREETDRLFAALAEGGTVTQKLQDMFWGSYYGSCIDKFGIQWMFNYTAK
jgi:PhnB protein